MTAIVRESTYLQLTPTGRMHWFRIPPLGTVMLIAAHFVFIVVLEFANNNVVGAQFWQARGVRAGWLTVTQVPLLILLVGKNNIIGVLSGVSYERLNVLHRWTARIMLFTAILHFGYQSYGWQQFGLMKLEWTTDSCPPTGIAAFAFLLWMNLSTLAPFRYLSYEFFVFQHLVTFFGFIIAVMYHLPSTALWSRIYIYIPIALYVLDRLVRALLFAFYNFPIKKATLTALDGGVTKVRLHNKSIKSWRPGSFVLLTIPKFGFLEGHPATIVSTPRSHNGDMIFFLKCQRGFTKRLINGANSSSTALLPHTKQESEAQQNLPICTYRALTNGPYGGSHADMATFDSLCLIAGSTGITFTLAILQDLADRVSVAEKKLPVRRIYFTWCVKDTSWTTWCSDELAAACAKLRKAGIDVQMDIYVTCTDAYTDQTRLPKECGCSCDKSLGPCCCVVVDDSDDRSESADNVQPVKSPSDAQPSQEKAVLAKPTVSSIAGKRAPTRLALLPCASFYSGRPAIEEILTELLDRANGESGVAVCGPIAMSSTVRNTFVRLSDERAIHKGSGAQGCYLHVESFS